MKKNTTTGSSHFLSPNGQGFRFLPCQNLAGPVPLRSPLVPSALILRLKYGARRIDGNYPADIMTRDDFERVQATTSYGKYKATTYIVYVLTEKAAVELLELQA